MNSIENDNIFFGIKCNSTTSSSKRLYIIRKQLFNLAINQTAISFLGPVTMHITELLRVSSFRQS
ncbi:MAG: hypothetical protein WBL68_02185 [Nitrososphaeraceae archaeon]